MKTKFLTMTALSTLFLSAPILNSTADAASNLRLSRPQISNNIKKPRIRLIRPKFQVKVNTKRLTPRATRLPIEKDIVKAGPQPEPPTHPKKTRVTRSAKQALAPFPRPRPDRPYNEFEDADNGLDAGPATELPEDDKLFDEDQIARLPETWGKIPFDILELYGRGAIDGAFDNPPGAVGLFPPGDNGPGDLTDYNPGERIQRGGPNDPDARDQIPEFFDDPFNPKTGNQDQGPRNPSNVISDPRGMASDGRYHEGVAYNTPSGGTYSHDVLSPVAGKVTTDSLGNQHGTTTTTTLRESRYGRTRITTITDENGKDVFRERRNYDPTTDDTVVTETNLGGTIRYIQSGDTTGGSEVFIHPDDTAGRSGPDSQPAPIDGEGGGIDVAMCGTFIPMWICTRGAGGPTPDDMRTQPSETGSIVGSGAGEDLGLRQDMVTNTGDGSFNTERGRGGGGGSGGVDDWRNPGDPNDPRF